MRLNSMTILLPLLALGYLLLPGMVWAFPSEGGISLGQTRVVFLSTDKAQTLTVKNTGNRSYLIQSQALVAPGDTNAAPFLVTPPLFTLRPDSHQFLRILLVQKDKLPNDRESVFYLSMLAIPAKEEKAASAAQVSLGMRIVIKLFYRPTGLKEMGEISACRLQFRSVPEGIRIENPTPYFQTLGQLMFNQTPVNLNNQPSMLAPLSAQIYPAPRGNTAVEWKTITDYGGLSTPCQQTVLFTQERS